MQPFSSTHAPLTDVTSNPYLDEPAKTNPTGTLGKFAVAVQSGITSFFSSLSPNYIPEHQRQTSQPTAPVVSTLPADNKNDKTSLADNFVQGVGLASKALSCWVPNVSAVTDAIGTICSYVSLANSLDNMAVSGKSGKSGKEQASGSENVSKHHSQKVTDKKQEDEKPDKPVTALGTAKRVSGPAMASATLMAMDQLADAAALPAEGRPGAWNNPIPVEDSATLGKIGRNDSYPMDAHYQQTRSFSHNTSVPVGSDSRPFQGHYDGGCHTISEASGRKQNRPVNRCGSSMSGAAAATLAMVALDRLSGAAAVPSAGTPGSPDNPIPVGDSETLGKIGQDGFPPDAYYRQTKTFSHNSSVSVGNDDHPFTGHYNGDCYTISDSRRCLFHKLGRYSEVRDLRVANANINNTDKFSAALACEMEGKSTIRDVRIEDSRIINNRESERFDLACTGVITGLQQKDSVVERAEVKNSSVSTSGDYSAAGIGAGITEGKMHRLNVEEALVTTSGSHSDAGIGAGAMEGQIEQLTVSDSQVETRGSHAHAGIGGGEVDGVIQHLTVSGTNVTTDQYGADAGIGGGMVTGNINNITVVKSEVTTNGSLAYAGIGGGQVGHFRPGPFGGGTLRKGSINDLVALESHVRTEGNFASAGIGGGYVHDRVKGTTAVNCTVSARGRGGNDGAAIGAGFNTGKVINTRAVECTVTTDTGDNAGIAHGGFGRGAVIEDVRSLNSRVNSKLVNVGNLTMPGLCRTADPRLVTSDCQEHPGPVMDNPWNCSTTPLIAKRGSVWNPIPINDSKTFNKIGLDADYPPDAHYIQTGDLEGSELNNDKTVVFSGHYDGQKRIIDQQTMCLFPDLRGSVNNLQVVNARVSAENEAAAVVACTMDGTSRIGNIKVVNASVTIHGDSPAEGGIITAQQLSRESRIENIEVHNCTVETRGRDQLAGMVAGEIRGQVDDVTVQNSRISTQGYKAHGGIGGGLINGKLSHLTSVCNNVEVSGSDAFAGIGGGQIDPRGEVRDLTAINSTVRTMSDGANAGVGAGYISHAGKANTITALNCRVFTMGNGANAGVGAGKVGRYGELNAITAVNSEVIAVGGNSSAGVAAGVAAGGFADKSDARLTDISNVNTRVNFQTYSDTNISADTLCASADQHFVSSDCQLSSSLPDGTCPITTPMTTFTGMPLTLPTSSTMAAAAPAIATGLSTGAIAGIAVGVTAVVAVAGLGGVCLYRYYHREKESEPQQLLQLGDI